MKATLINVKATLLYMEAAFTIYRDCFCHIRRLHLFIYIVPRKKSEDWGITGKGWGKASEDWRKAGEDWGKSKRGGAATYWPSAPPR